MNDVLCVRSVVCVIGQQVGPCCNMTFPTPISTPPPPLTPDSTILQEVSSCQIKEECHARGVWEKSLQL